MIDFILHTLLVCDGWRIGRIMAEFRICWRRALLKIRHCGGILRLKRCDSCQILMKKGIY
jgi:hypothetical protein